MELGIFIVLAVIVIISLTLFSKKLDGISERLSPEEQKNLKKINSQFEEKIQLLTIENDNLKKHLDSIKKDIESSRELKNKNEMLELNISKGKRVINDSEELLKEKDSEIRELKRNLSGQTETVHLLKIKQQLQTNSTLKNAAPTGIQITEDIANKIIQKLDNNDPDSIKLAKSLIEKIRDFHRPVSTAMSRDTSWLRCRACGSDSPNLCRCSE